METNPNNVWISACLLCIYHHTTDWSVTLVNKGVTFFSTEGSLFLSPDIQLFPRPRDATVSQSQRSNCFPAPEMQLFLNPRNATVSQPKDATVYQSQRCNCFSAQRCNGFSAQRCNCFSAQRCNCFSIPEKQLFLSPIDANVFHPQKCNCFSAQRCNCLSITEMQLFINHRDATVYQSQRCNCLSITEMQLFLNTKNQRCNCFSAPGHVCPCTSISVFCCKSILYANLSDPGIPAIYWIITKSNMPPPIHLTLYHCHEFKINPFVKSSSKKHKRPRRKSKNVYNSMNQDNTKMHIGVLKLLENVRIESENNFKMIIKVS